METCEICHKEKVHQFLTDEQKKIFKKVGLKDIILNTWIYSCKCPVLILEEIVYVRDKKVKFNKEEWDIFCSFVKQKKAWFNSLEVDYDTANRNWEHARKDLDNNADVERIQRGIWHLLYNLKCLK